MTDIAVSRNGKAILIAFFGLLIVCLYAPIVLLVVFSFNDNTLPVFPLTGFTFDHYEQFASNPELKKSLVTSGKVAALASTITVVLAIVASIALVRRNFTFKPGVSALLLSPLVIPYIVFAVALLTLVVQANKIWEGFPDPGTATLVAGDVVVLLPYAILVFVPRLARIDVRLEEAAFDLGASAFRTFRSITLPLILPAVLSAFLIAFTTSFDEYAVASFVVGSRTTFPIYLYSALRFPSQLPQVIAVAVVVIGLSLLVVIAAEIGRRAAERRLDVA
jgi:spermidine/putrescine transport system permease protein